MTPSIALKTLNLLRNPIISKKKDDQIKFIKKRNRNSSTLKQGLKL